MKKARILSVLLVSVLFAVATAGCGGSGGSTSSSQQGTLGVSLTDAPACGFAAVNVTVNKVRVHQSATADENSTGWSDITLSPSRKINLLSLTNGALENLGQVPLPVGHYTQMRLVLDANTGTTVANSVVLSGTVAEIPLNTPSSVQSGIKLINEFDVAEGQRVDLVLDFNACKSVVPRGIGGYALMPVISVIPTVVNGIDGFVDPTLIASNARVSAQVNGVEVRSTIPDAVRGEFFLARLPLANYDVVITADGHATVVIAAVPVVSTTGSVSISNSGSPISLPVSTTRNISGTVTLIPVSPTEAAYVSAKQTIEFSRVVTVKTQGADMLSGAYLITLPIGAPLLGHYGTGALPIALTAQSAVAGMYTVDASAAGYQNPSFNLDITSADAVHDFTLVP